MIKIFTHPVKYLEALSIDQDWTYLWFNSMMITIRPILKEEIPAAKRVILTVGYGIFGWDGSLEDSINYFENSNEFVDMDNLQAHYFDNSGLFLAALDDGRLVGTGAIRKLDGKIAELKRIWLLDEYQGQGIGFQLVTRLFNFASAHGYKYIRLQTSPQQKRAIAFYKKLGFLKIPCYNEDKEAVSMEIALEGTN
jgi:putative acetyltransferase